MSEKSLVGMMRDGDECDDETGLHERGHDHDDDDDDEEEEEEPDDVNLDVYYMRRALRVASNALDIGEVPVGCVIVLRDAADVEGTHSSSHSSSSHPPNSCDDSNSVIVSHGANQVNATRDATRHAELVAIDRMINRGRSSDALRLPYDVMCGAYAHGRALPPISGHSSTDGTTATTATTTHDDDDDDDDRWINVPNRVDHWKNSYGWGSGRIYDCEILKKCTSPASRASW